MRLRAMPTCRGLETEPGRPRGPGPTFSEVAVEWWGSWSAKKGLPEGCRDSFGEGPQARWRREGPSFQKEVEERCSFHETKRVLFKKLSWRCEESYDTQKYGIMMGEKTRASWKAILGAVAPFTSSQRPGQAKEGQAEILGGLGISWRCWASASDGGQPGRYLKIAHWDWATPALFPAPEGTGEVASSRPNPPQRRCAYDAKKCQDLASLARCPPGAFHWPWGPSSDSGGPLWWPLTPRLLREMDEGCTCLRRPVEPLSVSSRCPHLCCLCLISLCLSFVFLLDIISL